MCYVMMVCIGVGLGVVRVGEMMCFKGVFGSEKGELTCFTLEDFLRLCLHLASVLAFFETLGHQW